MNLSESWFYAMHPEELEEEKEVEQEKTLEIQFDASFLLYLVPEEHKWILSLS
jgi:hypothetical protein